MLLACGPPATVAAPSSARVSFRGRARLVPSGRARVVRAALPGGPHRAAGAGLARHRARPRHADRGADRLRQDARGVPRVHRSAAARGGGAGRRAARRHRRRLRLAAQGAHHRRAEEPGDAARRAPRARGRARARAARDPRAAAHRRHHRRRARRHAAAPAAPPRHDARVAVPAAHVGAQPRAAAQGAHRDRRRDPRAGRRQARRASGAQPRAARGAVRRAAAAHRPLRHAAPDRDDRALARRRRALRAACAIVDLGPRRDLDLARRGARQRARPGGVARAVGRDPRPHRRAGDGRTARRSCS